MSTLKFNLIVYSHLTNEWIGIYLWPLPAKKTKKKKTKQNKTKKKQQSTIMTIKQQQQ